MMDELLVIIGAELILLVSIAAMSLRGRRMDVLSGTTSATRETGLSCRIGISADCGGGSNASERRIG
jgi:hypothetical protein